VGQVLLVRHGQASWGAADYDVLSPLGERQAVATGGFLAGLRPDAVVHGLMQRQRRTAELMAEAAGWSLAPSVDGRWDEMDHLAVLDAQPRDFDGEPDARRLALRLVDEANVGLAPGTAFGSGGERFMRLCFARSAEQLAIAMERLAHAISSTK